MEDQVLGKQVAYPQKYCPEILVAVPRQINREIYGIEEHSNLFIGYDTWHAYEASCLLNNGMPVCGILKIVYSASSPFLVESKSLKLYLASYNMEMMGQTKFEAVNSFCMQVKQDLSQLLHTKVETYFFDNNSSDKPLFDFADYQVLEEKVNPTTFTISTYQENPAFLLENVISKPGELKVCSHLLKSNCKITRQPDWGSIYLHIQGETLPNQDSLLKYIISLRNENHFHEEICEMTFKRLMDFFNPEKLTVTCLYTRRGGIDICPSRSNMPDNLPTYLINPRLLTQRSFRQ